MISPRGDRIAVELEPSKPPSTIIHLINDERLRVGKVIAVGAGAYLRKSGARRSMDVAVGERVVFFREQLLTSNGKQVTRLMQEHGDNQALIHIDDVLFAIEPGADLDLSGNLR